MQQPGWYLRRLRRMSGAEVAYRLARSVRTVSTVFTRHKSPDRDAFATDLRFLPPTVQPRLPIMIGGSGPRKTLPVVARYADMWNAFGTPPELQERDSLLRALCDQVGRDTREIERTVGCKITIRPTQDAAERALDVLLANNHLTRASIADDHTFWTGTPERLAGIMTGYAKVGFRTFIVELPAPYDIETMETLMGVVKPMVEAAQA